MKKKELLELIKKLEHEIEMLNAWKESVSHMVSSCAVDIDKINRWMKTPSPRVSQKDIHDLYYNISKLEEKLNIHTNSY